MQEFKSLKQALSPGQGLFKILGGFVIAIVVVVTYYSGLKVGFWSDDYAFLEVAARLSLQDYLVWYFDPRVQALWYRPIPGMLWWIEWHAFQGDALGYHLVYVLIHLANCLLLSAIVSKVTKEWLAGLVSALMYAGMSVYSHAVLRPSDETAFATLFYLLTVLFWLGYLTKRKGWKKALAYFSFLLALFSKEANVTLPVILFLLDWLVVGGSVSVNLLMRRYMPFVLFLIPYLAFEITLAPNTVYRNALGYGFGMHIFPVLGEYLTHLAFPWGLDPPLDSLWLFVLFLTLAFIIITRRDFRWLFLVIAILVICAPYALFQFFFPRFLYLPMLFSAAAIGSLCAWLQRRFASQRWRVLLLAGGLVGIVTINAIGTTREIEWLTHFAKEGRLPVRAISQKYPSLPDDTFLYFIDPPVPLYGGMFLLQYGPQVSVGGDIGSYETIWRNVVPKPAGLRKYATTYVIYFDEQGGVKEQKVEREDRTADSLALPIKFGPIQLSGYEIASVHVKRGEAIVVLLYWQATEPIDRDYTVFAHLVDATGQILAGSDNQPRGGGAPTRYWQKDKRVIDWAIIPIDEQVPLGEDYRLVIGWYYFPTMERLTTTGADGGIRDSFVIEPFSVTK